jgi:hypothetical protein
MEISLAEALRPWIFASLRFLTTCFAPALRRFFAAVQSSFFTVKSILSRRTNLRYSEVVCVCHR